MHQRLVPLQSPAQLFTPIQVKPVPRQVQHRDARVYLKRDTIQLVTRSQIQGLVI